MRRHLALLLAAVLSLGLIAAAPATHGASEQPSGAPPSEVPSSDAPASEAPSEATGRLQFAHAAEGAPPLRAELRSPGGDALGSWSAAQGATVDIVPSVPLVPGTYGMTVRAGEGGATLATFDVPVAAGFTTVVTAYADQVGRLLFILDTPDGEQTIRPVFEGGVIVEHDIDGGPTVSVVLWVLTYEDRARTLGTVEPGETLEATVEAGPHVLLLYEDGDELGRTDIFVVDDETTVVRVSDILVGPRPLPSDTPAAGDSSTGDVPRPTRIDTGAGGAAERSAPPPAALVAAATLLGMGALLRRGGRVRAAAAR